MRLNEDARLALVGLAQIVAGLDGFSDSIFEICGLGDAGAVGAAATEVGQAVGFCWFEAVDCLGEHESERVFACAARAGQDHGVRKAAGADAFAQVRDRGGVAQKIAEGHETRLAGGREQGTEKTGTSGLRDWGSEGRRD